MTHWKKNIDSKFISGEDLIASLNGLKPEMVVTLTDQKDAKTFDQKLNADVVKTSLYFTDQGGKALYKPAILNKTNAKFFEKETGTPEMESWYGRTVVMFAQKDSRHGHVVRFKSYIKPTLQSGTEPFNLCKTAIQKSGYTMDQIRQKYTVSTEIEKLLMDGKTI